MKDQITDKDEACPFEFNFDADTFKAGDIVSYRIPDRFDDMPFVGHLISVAEDHVMLAHYDPVTPQKTIRGTRESRPVVSSADALS
ncbi:MAG: hypothetical protein WCY88_15540 [Spongiibacteraceae bacterium]